MEKLGPRVRVRSVQPLRGFTALITFENGVQKEINLEPYFHRSHFRTDPQQSEHVFLNENRGRHDCMGQWSGY